MAECYCDINAYALKGSCECEEDCPCDCEICECTESIDLWSADMQECECGDAGCICKAQETTEYAH